MKKILLFLMVCSGKVLSAQTPAERPFVWGGLISYDVQLLGIQNPGSSEPEQIRVESGRAAHGGSVGVFGKWHLWNGLWVQQAVTLSTLQSRVFFQPGGVEYYRFTDLELPLHFVLTNPSREKMPLRGSFLLGARVGWNFAAQNTRYLHLLRERLAVDAGMGVEIRLKKWRLQPEFVYSLGLNNLHNISNTPYDWVVGRIIRDRFTLRLLIWRAEK